MQEWPGNKYHIVRCNCNAFADELAVALTGSHIPGWVNRLAYIGSLFSCLLPASMGGGPAADTSASDGASTEGSGFTVSAPSNRRAALGGVGGSNAYARVGAGGGGGVGRIGSTATASSTGAAGGVAATTASSNRSAAERRVDREKLVAAALQRMKTASSVPQDGATNTTSTSSMTI